MAEDHGMTDQALAHALLAACVDGPDPAMHALLGQCGDAARLLDLLRATAHADGDQGPAAGELDRMFVRAAQELGMSRMPSFAWFHRHRDEWCARLREVPGMDGMAVDRDRVMEALTHGGRQWVLTPDDPHWPSQLADLALRTDSAPPLCLWGMGERAVFSTCTEPIAVVGSRMVDDYGRSTAHAIGKVAAAGGHLVVSGGALGADAAAHWGALSRMRRADADGGAGRTVAVLAGGVDMAGPAANANLFSRIVASGGALVSERPPGTVPLAHRFLERNRIIAALAKTIVVAQARMRSGALNTAQCGAEMVRDIYVVPGPIDSPLNAGCNWCVYRQKAALLPAVNELAELVHAAHPAKAARTPDSVTAGTGTSTAMNTASAVAPDGAPDAVSGDGRLPKEDGGAWPPPARPAATRAKSGRPTNQRHAQPTPAQPTRPGPCAPPAQPMLDLSDADS